ncbi:Secreted protein acidic and rich in cysteine Ca binding region [Popillia japonica]|uniref:Secreted protein acidic and rich in cysteine Ca binding region n=1 Tax=Popillia japonica TaxID=7064 RepID=A0AAW1NBZ2_POPJA
MCGSDNISYPNKCLLELAQCYNNSITQKHKGHCRRPIKCVDYTKTSSSSSVLELKCRSDGNFAGSQCSNKLGYCWCVNSQGAPMDYTLTQYSPSSKPRCSRKKTTRRRSSPKNGRKSNRPCKREDKAKFNINLVKIFQTEFMRENELSSPPEGNLFTKVLDWKFQQMDKNNDNMLDKDEYKDLKKIVKKAVKPKRCAKTFSKACDVNEDEFIGRQEWADCLTRDGIDEGGPMEGSNVDSDDEDDDDVFPEYPPIPIMPSTNQPPDGVLQTEVIPGDDSAEQREEDTADCRSDRQTALGEMKANSKNDLYVPECTPDGRYQKIQCYKSTGYCWCVHEDTGKNIPGTSVKNQEPKCDQVVSVSRSIKGCPEAKKNIFLKSLIDFLHEKMVKDINGTKIASANRPAWNTTREERVASWSFVIFDKNKNKILEKNEWKLFKETVTGVKSLRKCGKKLPRYCDKNKDKEITLTEWLECLSKRDHFTDILKED